MNATKSLEHGFETGASYLSKNNKFFTVTPPKVLVKVMAKISKGTTSDYQQIFVEPPNNLFYLAPRTICRTQQETHLKWQHSFFLLFIVDHYIYILHVFAQMYNYLYINK